MSLTDNVLTFVNTERTDMGLPVIHELPKGLRNNSCQCPVARAFTAGAPFVPNAVSTHTMGTVIYDFTLFERGRHEIVHPDYVQQFVMGFDEGRMPELIDEAA